MRVQPWSGVAALELTIVDDTGALTVVFFGRRHLPGVATGTRLVVEGVVGEHQGRLAMLNPAYEILPGSRPTDDRARRDPRPAVVAVSRVLVVDDEPPSSDRCPRTCGPEATTSTWRSRASRRSGSRRSATPTPSSST